jgi:hypothetical protein
VGPEEEWLWHGFIERGAVVLLSAYWKAGKTTLLAHLMKAFGTGAMFLGHKVTPVKVIYVTEESEPRWAKRRDNLELGDWLFFRCRPFLTKPRQKEWESFLEDLKAEVEEKAAGLVVLDTLSNLWPVVNENDAGEVAAACMPMRSVSDLATLLPVHHLKKGDGKEATGTRGSGGLLAFPDSIIEMRRFDADDRADRRRVLTGYGRSDDTVQELVIELSEDGKTYMPHGDRHEATSGDMRKVIASLLPREPPGLKQEEVRADWPTEPAPHLKKIIGELNAGHEKGLWLREGDGKKGSPFHYRNRAGFVDAGKCSSTSAPIRPEVEENPEEGDFGPFGV